MPRVTKDGQATRVFKKSSPNGKVNNCYDYLCR